MEPQGIGKFPFFPFLRKEAPWERLGEGLKGENCDLGTSWGLMLLKRRLGSKGGHSLTLKKGLIGKFFQKDVYVSRLGRPKWEMGFGGLKFSQILLGVQWGGNSHKFLCAGAKEGDNSGAMWLELSQMGQWPGNFPNFSREIVGANFQRGGGRICGSKRGPVVNLAPKSYSGALVYLYAGEEATFLERY